MHQNVEGKVHKLACSCIVTFDILAIILLVTYTRTQYKTDLG